MFIIYSQHQLHLTLWWFYLFLFSSREFFIRRFFFSMYNRWNFRRVLLRLKAFVCFRRKTFETSYSGDKRRFEEEDKKSSFKFSSCSRRCRKWLKRSSKLPERSASGTWPCSPYLRLSWTWRWTDKATRNRRKRSRITWPPQLSAFRQPRTRGLTTRRMNLSPRT